MDQIKIDALQEQVDSRTNYAKTLQRNYEVLSGFTKRIKEELDRTKLALGDMQNRVGKAGMIFRGDWELVE